MLTPKPGVSATVATEPFYDDTTEGYQKYTDLSKCQGYRKLEEGKDMCVHTKIKAMLEAYGDAAVKVWPSNEMGKVSKESTKRVPKKYFTKRFSPM